MRIIRFNHFLACPCHTDCIDGCQGCDNPVCFCNVSRNNQYRTVNVINTYLRTTRMMITWMLVSIRPAKLSANVFWIAKMILGAKLLVCRPSKMNIPSVLARFAKLIITFSDSFSQEKCPLGCPCDDYDCDLPEKKAILTLYSASSSKPTMIQKFMDLVLRH